MEVFSWEKHIVTSGKSPAITLTYIWKIIYISSINNGKFIYIIYHLLLSYIIYYHHISSIYHGVFHGKIKINHISYIIY